ncbi:MAG TPA: EamA family transporter, partial [Halomonas sp.]|nr:EamA family transporter [Halomonas sp.]
MWKRLPFRLRGYLITMSGVLLLSPDALLVKDTTVDVATFMFWRGVMLGVVLLLIAAARYRERLVGAIRACGPAAVWCPLAFAASAWAFVIATRLTSAGNVLVMLNLAPLVAGLIGLLFFRQRLRRQTWVVIAICITGASLMAAGEVGQG